MGTEEDFRTRKAAAMGAMRKWDHIWKHKDIPNQKKIEYFNVFVQSIFMYNAELWSTTADVRGRINSFQRRLLRKAVNIQWPKKISNEQLKARVTFIQSGRKPSKVSGCLSWVTSCAFIRTHQPAKHLQRPDEK
eukprot:GHVN01028580.1.p1 GENE.GHVN01028580.1~~GHVN01028580.1.p1  ORF type:complete len:144 (+),score=0.33 GHVN01028580.1:32-433(+)